MFAMRHPCNDIFRMMRRQYPGNSGFGEETVGNWYGARRYVLDHFPRWISGTAGSGGGQAFRIAIGGYGGLAYAVVRHIALMAHFPEFDEEKDTGYSTITIIYPERFGIKELKAEIIRLGEEEHLFNLIKYSSYTLVDACGKTEHHPGLPFLDILFVLKATDHYEPADGEIYITEEEITDYAEAHPSESFTDGELTAAMLVNQAYSTGAEIRNLSSTENDKASRYRMALDCLNSSKRKDARRQWKDCLVTNVEGKGNLSRKALAGVLSCIFCADTFEIRLHQIMEINEDITHEYLIANVNTIRRRIITRLNALSKSEHARWNAEKLILGFRPLNAEECYTEEMSVGQRDEYRSRLKKKEFSPAHIDITSFADLKRISPEDQKYDYFIMLAIPTILIRKYPPRSRISRFIARFI